MMSCDDIIRISNDASFHAFDRFSVGCLRNTIR